MAWQRIVRVKDLDNNGINRAYEVVEYASGKGLNCVQVLKLLKHNASLLTFHGGVYGELWYNSCVNEVAVESIKIQDSSRMCTTIISDSGEISEVIDPTPKVLESEKNKFIEKLKELILEQSEVGVVAFCGSFLNGVDSNFLSQLLDSCSQKKIYLDGVNQVDEILKHGVELLKINEIELLLLYDKLARNTSSICLSDKIKTLCEMFGIAKVVVTRGKDSVLAYDNHLKEVFEVKVPQVKCINSIGAGDTFMASMIDSFEQNLGFEQSLKKSVALSCAKLEVLKPQDVDLEYADELFKSLKK